MGAAVPEPAPACLLTLVGLGVMARRRRVAAWRLFAIEFSITDTNPSEDCLQRYSALLS